MSEEWRNIPGFDMQYFVSSEGRVKRVKKDGSELIYAAAVGGPGYFMVSLGGKIKVTVHRLVALAFLPNPDNLRTVNHKDLNKLNNRVENLEWMSDKDNINHARETYGNYNALGEKNGKSKLTEAQVREIREMLKAGLPQRVIAEQFGISRGPVDAINRGICWSHVK